MPKLPFQMPELPFQMPELPFQIPELCFQMAELLFKSQNNVNVFKSQKSVFGLIYENFRQIGFEQISGHSIFDNMLYEKHFFCAWSPKRASLDHAGLTGKCFWLPVW
jgi:hypothetical protein